jgi:molecular chaperone GrpE (heat shock protein)
LVNNDPILWAMLNAIKEQQQQIQRQQVRIAQLTRELQDVHEVQAENVSLHRELLRMAEEVEQIWTQLQREQGHFNQTTEHAVGN